MRTSYTKMLETPTGGARLALIDLVEISQFARPADVLGKGVGGWHVPDKSYYMSRINVPSFARRRGIANELMAALIKDADAEGATIFLGCSASGEMDNLALERWYQKLGFEKTSGILMRRYPAARRTMIEDKPRRLTRFKLKAIEEALTSRLAGEIDTGIKRQAYEEALIWATQQLRASER